MVTPIKKLNVISTNLTVLSFLILLSINIQAQKQVTDIKLGIDVLLESNFDIIQGKKVALLTNHSGRNAEGRLTAEIMAKSNLFSLEYILTPEHGFYTSVPAGDHVDDSNINGVKIHSLYGASRKPDINILKRCDVIVVDLQDIGVRSYTYLSTLYKTMQAAAEINMPLLVLDRPNPLGGIIVDGNTVEKGKESFVSIIPVSYIHGCTFGELAEMINNENWLENNKKCNLTVVKMKNWERWMHWNDTGLFWFPTSPHVPTEQSVKGIATTGIIGELGIISIGIGTTLPFQYIGNLSFDSEEFIKIMDNNIQGIRLEKAVYRPFYGMYSGKYVNSAIFQFEESNDLKPYSTAIQILLALRKIEPQLFESNKIKANSQNMFKKVTGTDELFDAIFKGSPDDEVIKISQKGLLEFVQTRNKYLLYE